MRPTCESAWLPDPGARHQTLEVAGGEVVPPACLPSQLPQLGVSLLLVVRPRALVAQQVEIVDLVTKQIDGGCGHISDARRLEMLIAGAVWTMDTALLVVGRVCKWCPPPTRQP